MFGAVPSLQAEGCQVEPSFCKQSASWRSGTISCTITLTHLSLVDSSTALYGQFHFLSKGCLVCFLALPFIMEIPVFNANSADPDQMPHSAASDLDLHCLLISLFGNARHRWVKTCIT